MSELYPTPVVLLEIALETGAFGPVMGEALCALQDSERAVRAVLELLQHSRATEASHLIAEQLATPARLGMLLREEPIDWSAADAVIGQLGSQAAPTLLGQLVVADARAVRRAIMDRLVRLGPAIGSTVLEHVDDERWQVVRNMAVLLRQAGCEIEPSLGDRLALHPDPRVRREALLLRLERTGAPERALSDALRDPDEHVMRAALDAAGNYLPGSGVLVLARRLGEPGFPAGLRVTALGLLGRSNAPLALEALLRAVDGGRTLLGKAVLAPKSPELLAGLAGLARSWSCEVRASEFLRLAGRSDDPDILAAIRPQAMTEAKWTP